MAGTVLTGVTAGVATLTLNRPERLNALNATLLADLCAALDDVLADDKVGVLVLRGAGRAFCSGDDLKDIENQTAGEAETRAFIEAIQEVSRRLVLGDKVWSAPFMAGPWAAGWNGRSTAISPYSAKAPNVSSRRSSGACSRPAA